MRRWRCLVLAVCLLGLLVAALGASAAGKQQLFLVIGQETELAPLTTTELRRLFLGFTVDREGQPLRPLINRNDQLSYQVFLQTVVGMSARTYERQLLSQLYRRGIQPPPVYTSLRKLTDALKAQPGTVSFALGDELEEMAGVKSVQVLWEQSSR